MIHPLTLSVLLPSLIVLFAFTQFSWKSYRIAMMRDAAESGRLVGMTVDDAAAALDLPDRPWRQGETVRESVVWLVDGPALSRYEIRMKLDEEGRVREVRVESSS